MSSNKIDYLLFLADSNLILSQKTAEWCGHGPVLEQDIAITNITLDLLGQARNFYQYAASLIGNTDEDKLAYLRTEREFKNLLLCELPKGDWAQSVLKLFFFSAYTQPLYSQLLAGKDEQVAAIAEKSLKETIYHLRWSSEWIIRMGDGTAESNTRLNSALQYLWPFVGEMFAAASYETADLVDLEVIKSAWIEEVSAVLEQATLPMPDLQQSMQRGGKQGIHTEHMGFILAELQY